MNAYIDNVYAIIAGLRLNQLTAPGYLDQAMKGESIKEYLRSQLGATIKYRPSYSCGLNPIEQVFAKLKALLRKAAERTYDKFW